MAEELGKKAEKSFEKARRRNIALDYGSYYDGYFAGAKENGIIWHKIGTPRENVLTIIEIENCGYLLCRYRNGFWYEDNSGAICAEFITNNILQWAEIPTFSSKESEMHINETERLEEEKCELFGIIQGKDKVIKELQKRIEGLEAMLQE